MSKNITLPMLLLLLLLCGCSQDENKALNSETRFLLDTACTVSADCDDETLSGAFAVCEELERLLSRTVKGSDVYRLNETDGFVSVSDDTLRLLEKSVYYGNLTDGKFDITVCPVSELWDFKNQIVPSRSEIAEALKNVDYHSIEIKENTANLNGKKIDLGGIAKGYTSSRVMQIFKEYGIEHGMVNLGGNVQTLGTKTDGTAWRVAIQSPQGGNQYLGILETSNQAVITSGGYERYFEENGVTYHHIIDPKTGYPSDSDLTSVTIVCADGTKADALSTSFFVMGLQKAESFYENTDLDFDVILLTKDNQIYISEGIAQNFTSDYTVNVLKK